MQFEVDLSAPLPGGGGRRREVGSPDGEEMDRESLLQQLNVDSMGLGWEDETESDQEVGPTLLMNCAVTAALASSVMTYKIPSMHAHIR